jgi:hypothetical protein
MSKTTYRDLHDALESRASCRPKPTLSWERGAQTLTVDSAFALRRWQEHVMLPDLRVAECERALGLTKTIRWGNTRIVDVPGFLETEIEPVSKKLGREEYRRTLARGEGLPDEYTFRYTFR